MIDDIRKKKDKGTRKLEKFLEEKGYVIIEHDKKGKHESLTVKRAEEVDNPDAQTVKTILSHRVTGSGDAPSRMKMVLRDIEHAFAGRKKRGQGEFKLSEDISQKEKWFGVLKRDFATKQNARIYRLVAKPIIADFVEDYVMGMDEILTVNLKRDLDIFLKEEGLERIKDILTTEYSFGIHHIALIARSIKKKGNLLIMARAMIRDMGFESTVTGYVRKDE